MLSAEGVTGAQEEYVETQYYNELHSIDKQHHTVTYQFNHIYVSVLNFWIFVLNLDFFSFFEQTGNGFIRVVGEVGEGGYDILLQEGTGGMAYTGFRSNPATNDWVPNIDEDQVLGVPCLESHRGREDL